MHNHALRGMALMALSVFLIISMNMFAKLVTDTHSFIEAVFYRNIIAFTVITVLIAGQQKPSLYKTKRGKGQAVRAVMGTVGVICVFWAYSLMPMAEVTAIMFTSGLMTTAMSALILKEHVGLYRWSAVIIGFIGALIIVSPDASAITPEGAIITFTAAFIGGGVVSIMLRSLGKTENAQTTVFYFTGIGSLMTAPYALVFGTLPTWETVWPLMGCGLAGVISLLCKTQAYRYAEAALLSPITYTGIIWATMFGWFIWNDWPSNTIWMGATVIIGSNLFILWREQHLNAKKSQARQVQYDQ